MFHLTFRKQPLQAALALILFAGLAATGVLFPEPVSAEELRGATGEAIVIGPPTPAVYQDAFVKASNPGLDDFFGYSAAYANGTLVIGAPFENGGDSGVNGAQGDDSLNNAGAAYVYTRTSVGWRFEAYLKAEEPLQGARFGDSVATDGNTVVVGAPRSGADDAGRAYVFVRSGFTWGFLETLEPGDGRSLDNFGTSVAVSGGLVAVGAINDDGIGDGNSNSGSVFLFTVGGGPLPALAVQASHTEPGDDFGASVALSGSLMVVGAPGEDGPGNSDNGTGAAYVYAVGPGSASLLAYLRASNADDFDAFGDTVAISGTTVVVGAAGEDSRTVGVNGDSADDSFQDSGAAYVFSQGPSGWTQEAYLKASNTEGGDAFGTSVAVSDHLLVVGAVREDSAATGIGGSQGNSTLGSSSGAAYVFQRIGGGLWGQVAYVKASNTGASDTFGSAVAAHGDTIVVGAINDDSYSKLINGDQEDDFINGRNSGAAYVFTGFFDR